VRIPPQLFAPSGSPAEEATLELMAAARPVAEFIGSLPDSEERRQAAIALNASLLWASQAVLGTMPHGRVVIARPNALPG
jgi:hypothetical protein